MPIGEEADFLSVKPGDIVVVESDPLVIPDAFSDWWVGQVIHVVGGARDPNVNSLFQIACVDTGLIRTVNGDLVARILVSPDIGC